MFPERRMRRMRRRIIQPLLRETELRKTDLIAPVFVDESISAPIPIASMPGQFRHPVDSVADYCERLSDAGIRAVLLFGVPAAKDSEATESYAADGVVQRAVREIKERLPQMVVVTDVCACEYTDHGHCGIVGETADGPDLLNDPSLELMAQIAVSHAESGADIVA
ncbi:MAG: porphobilinogen synthase, partial [Methanomicrobiales archaeon]|nr:porphobilinogen synthase [Methanomicrobiales archaeon]